MTRVLRLLLVLMLALAVPAKGMAAVMQACAGGPAGVAGMVPVSTQAPAHALHQAQSHHHDGHEHAAPHAHPPQPAALDASPHPAADPQAHDHGQGKCSVCAACGGAAAISAPGKLQLPELTMATPVAPVFLPVLSYITEGPRRPPRNIPA